MSKHFPAEYDKLDIGCGAQKEAGHVGLDHKPYPGVDVVFDLNSGEPWPFSDNTFRYIKAKHIVEHLHDTLHFFSEAHRVAADGAILHLETPHYSSRDSWIDPTHVRHFSLFFTDPIVDGSLLDHAEYVLVHRRLSFGSLVRTIPQRLWVAVFGLDSYERFLAWPWPARTITVDLKVVKRGKAGQP